MNAVKRLKRNRIDISVDKNAIYSNLFYGYEAPAATLPQKMWTGAKRAAAAVGRVIVLPFAWLGKAALFFVMPRDPRTAKEDNLMADTQVPYYRPPMKAKRREPVQLQPDVYITSAPAAPGAKKFSRVKRVKKARTMAAPMEAVAAVPVTATGVVDKLPAARAVVQHRKKKKAAPAADEIALSRREKKAQEAAVAVPVAKGSMNRGRRLAIAAVAVCLLGGIGFGAWYYFEGRYCVITVNDNGTPVEVRSAEATVGDILAENDMSLKYQDLIDCGTAAKPYEGMVVNITRAKNITITAAGKEHSIKLGEGTVKDALTQASIPYKEGDEISPSLDTELSDNMAITVVDVDVTYKTRTVSVPYRTIYKDSSTLLKGKTKVSQQGKNGVRTIKTKITTRDGKVAKTETVSNTITTQPVNKVVLQGTKVVKKKTTTKKTTTKKTTTKTTTKKPTVPRITTKASTDKTATGTYVTGYSAPASSIVAQKVKIGKITAYTHTGGRTATGKWPKVGMCAVNTNMFAYGTKLYIPGYGYAVAEDTGGFASSGANQIDLFMNTAAECRRWGVKRNVTVYVIK